jgi:hypothetical protein
MVKEAKGERKEQMAKKKKKQRIKDYLLRDGRKKAENKERLRLKLMRKKYGTICE